MTIHSSRRRITSRRGSTILLAVGVLATLAIVALVYLANVGAERSNTVRAVQEIPYAQASERVRDEIGSLLAADLFGNKITTPDVPQYVNPANFDTRIWPRMFEDGEFSDYPFVDGAFATTTFNLNRPWEGPSPRALLDPAGNADPSTSPSRDDAWLSTTEPDFQRTGPRAPFWPQITNLRDGYRWRPDLDRWVRADGRYADLGQWFLTNRAQTRGRGDSEADLSPDNIADFAEGPNVTPQRNTPERGLNQFIFGYQMNSLREVADNDASFGSLSQPDPNGGPRPIERADERFWADADGDLRPDSRWQTLDALDGFLGLKWVVAARIIDNSALINVNTAIDSGALDSDIQPPPSTLAGLYLPDGRTPADVDLFRLLFLANTDPTQDLLLFTNAAWGAIIQTGFGGANTPPSYYDWATSPPASGLPLRSAFREHLDKGLGLTPLVNNLYERTTATPRYNTGSDLNWRFSREERSAIYHSFLANRGERPAAGEAGRVYPLEDELELRTYWSTNDDRTLSELERRLDFGYMPGQSSTLPATPSDIRARLAGPLRAARPTTMDRSLQQTLRLSGQRQGTPTVHEIQDDTRHLLTTYNGVSNASPVPVLNPARITASANPQLLGRPVYDGQYGNTKIRIADFPDATATNPEELAKKASLIRRSFGAFTWALAPLATNEPIMSGLTDQDILDARNAATARGHDFHYGGGSSSTAVPPNNGGLIGSPVYTMGQASQALGGPADLGASYAILRAASLAVNLVDATDYQDDSLPDPTTPTEETPTVVRLFNIPEIDPTSPHNTSTAANYPNIAALSAANYFQAGVIPLGVRFSHGDIADPTQTTPLADTVRLPPRFMGAPDQGVTLIGLDRQPFLMEAWTLAYYDSGAGSTTPQIDPSSSGRQLGSIIAVELGNPWPEPLDLDNSSSSYVIRLQTQAGYVQLSGLSGTIEPGRSRIIWAAVGRSPSTDWSAVLDEWKSIIQGQIASTALFDPNASTGVELYLTGGSGPVSPLDPVVFQQIAQPVGAQTGVAAVTLWTNVNNVNALLDRIWVRNQTSTVFPAAYTGVVTIPQPPPVNGVPLETMWSGRVIAVSSVRRPTEPGSATGSSTAGFPAWVIEDAGSNVIKMEPSNAGGGGTAVGGWHQSWWTDATPMQPVPAAEDLLATATGGLQDLLGQTKEAFDHATANRRLPAFQMFVPNRPPLRTAGSPTPEERQEWDRLGALAFTSELHLLSTFTHMYFHSATDTGPDPRIDRAAVPAAMPAIFGMYDLTAGAGYWRTISEQLGDLAEITYDGSANNTPNPYLGVLDPSRYTLNSPAAPVSTGMGLVTNLPDALAVPLAIRAFDAFEVLDLPGDLAQGRMNINTAPVKALRMLPFVSPWFDIEVGAGAHGTDKLLSATAGGATSLVARNLDRAALIVDYRDAATDFGEFSGARARSDKLFYPGLRTVGEPPVTGSAGPVSLGFHYTGELALLAEWNDGVLTAPLSGTMRSFSSAGGLQYASFAELADASPSVTPSNAGVSTSSNAPGVRSVDSVLDVRPSGEGGATSRLYDPIDDAEERLAIFRAVSNIVSTRSDVYTAWFVVRAYDPRRIEAIEVPVSSSNIERAALLNQLEPTHESRWLAVFDRSNVKTPTDRPKVLLFTRLPK